MPSEYARLGRGCQRPLGCLVSQREMDFAVEAKDPAARTVKRGRIEPAMMRGFQPSYDPEIQVMNPAQKALWFIESHLAETLTLDEVAGIAGVSRFHLVRAFAAATGLPVMRYGRAR